MSTTKVVWLSLNPIKNEINFYPYQIANKIENKYNQRNINVVSLCELGDDFFNATVYFHPCNGCYQTTPGINQGIYGSKPPGMRSVKRIELTSTMKDLEILTKKYYKDWRIINSSNIPDKILKITIPTNVIINGTKESFENNTYWLSDDLINNDKVVVAWEWCKEIPKSQKDLVSLPENSWVPYLQFQNETIETSYNKNHEYVDITLLTDNTKRRIIFNKKNYYGSQIDLTNNNTRYVRRVILKISKLKEKLIKINNKLIDYTNLSTFIKNNEIPNEYICCISQEIMRDPVKTSDNHTYDRTFIEDWFQYRHTSPLTGLYLNDITLTPNTLLKNKIQEFIHFKILKTPLNEENTAFSQNFLSHNSLPSSSRSMNHDYHSCHPTGWCPENHYGYCGQSCPCCRFKVEGPNGFGICNICKNQQQHHARRRQYY